MLTSGSRKAILFLICVLAFAAFKVSAQTDYPFRNPKLGDDARIADLLGRLTLQEKVDLMDGHAKVPRLHLVLSDEAEGLHGLALGGPGSWGPRGTSTVAHHDFPAGEGPRAKPGIRS